MPSHDDQTLIRSTLNGDQAAFAALVDRYQAFVFTLVRRRVSEREIAEELAQDVFLKAYRFLSSFKGNSKFSTWLYTIAHTTCLSHLRLKAPSALLPGDDKVIHFSDLSQNNNDHTQQTDLKARQRRIELAIESLGGDDREIVTLFYQGGLKVEEISTVMNMSASNIKVRLFRSRQILKEKLKFELKELR
jgi:RNA polymerase sigma factor (sigma-70 family)